MTDFMVLLLDLFNVQCELSAKSCDTNCYSITVVFWACRWIFCPAFPLHSRLRHP